MQRRALPLTSTYRVTCCGVLVCLLTRRPQIVTGFLGSGKTTFINTVLNDSTHKLKIAVIENEFGEARSLRAWVAATGQLRAYC